MRRGRGVSHVLLEKTNHLSDTIYRYQKGKHVMATPVRAGAARLTASSTPASGRKSSTSGISRHGKAAGVNVRFNADVKAITGEQGRFHARTQEAGGSVMAENIILAVGTQGNPNLMRCEGGNLEPTCPVPAG